MTTFFCDVCGTKYEDGDLRATSKYCMQCGETLPKLIVDGLQDRQRPSPRERNRPACEPTTPFTVPTHRFDRPIEPLEETKKACTDHHTPHSPRNETRAVQSVSTRSSNNIHTPTLSPSVVSLTDLDYEQPDRLSAEIEAEDGDHMSVDASPSTLSLNIEDYDLPPAFPVPHRYKQLFPRRIISKILGGGHQITWPRARDRRHPMYACVRSNLNPTLPSQSGAHGIMVTGPVPKELVHPPISYVLIIACPKLCIVCETLD